MLRILVTKTAQTPGLFNFNICMMHTFRTPGSGLYDNLQKYQLQEPSAIFDTVYFHRNPRPFFSLAKELYPGQFCPSLAHCFVRLLQDKGVLLRNYTQNIDGLERCELVECVLLNTLVWCGPLLNGYIVLANGENVIT